MDNLIVQGHLFAICDPVSNIVIKIFLLNMQQYWHSPQDESTPRQPQGDRASGFARAKHRQSTIRKPYLNIK